MQPNIPHPDGEVLRKNFEKYGPVARVLYSIIRYPNSTNYEDSVLAAMRTISLDGLVTLEGHRDGDVPNPDLKAALNKLFVIRCDDAHPERPVLCVASLDILERLMDKFYDDIQRFTQIGLRLFEDVSPASETRGRLYEGFCHPVRQERRKK